MRSAAPCAFRISFWVILFSTLVVEFSFSQQPKVQAPHRPAPPKLEHPVRWHDPVVRRSMVGGLWMTDANFKSTIYLKNNVETDPLDVTPILYLSNGRNYTLQGVHLDAGGVATISINQALTEHGVASWATLTGHVEVQYAWPWDALCVSVEDVDVAHSMIFSYGLRSLRPASTQKTQQPSASAQHMFEGMWWKQEGSVIGFVAVSNTSSEQIRVSVQTADDQNRPLADHVVAVSPKGTKLLNLRELQQTASKVGGLRVTYTGSEGTLIVNGGLEDQSIGYSAAIPFSPVPVQAQNASAIRYAELGLMTGASDPMMSFPAGTVFTPYSVVRNISAESITLTPTLWWMDGGLPHSRQLNPVVISPRETQALEMQSLLSAAGLKNFSGNLNLTFDTQSQPGTLLMAGGSVDQKNTYVFEVRPTTIEESQGRSLSYWDTANGDDTMVTVWNPADEEQQFIFKLSFSGGHYNFPIHLGPKASYTFNISAVINNQIPDSEGNIIPPSIHTGSADLEGVEGENQDVLVAFDAGTYNVIKATCTMRCVTCHGATSFRVQTAPFGIKVSVQRQLNAIVQYDSGSQSDLTSTSSWSSSAGTIASVSTGLVRGVAAGTVNIVATSPTQTIAGTECQQYTPPPCPRTPLQDTGPGTVYQCGIYVNFTGGKSPGDTLSFPSGNQTLGLKNLSDRWIWQVEVAGTVTPPNAAAWTLQQSYTGRQKQIQKTSSGTLLAQTDTPLNVSNDSPDSPFRQQPSGNAAFYWIDGPGQLKSVGGNTVDSETQVENFTSSVVSPPDAAGFTTSCTSQWYLKLVIKPGGILDTVNTSAAPGVMSTNF